FVRARLEADSLVRQKKGAEGTRAVAAIQSDAQIGAILVDRGEIDRAVGIQVARHGAVEAGAVRLIEVREFLDSRGTPRRRVRRDTELIGVARAAQQRVIGSFDVVRKVYVDDFARDEGTVRRQRHGLRVGGECKRPAHRPALLSEYAHAVAIDRSGGYRSVEG